MKNLAHSASLHSGEKNAPSNPGTKHLAVPQVDLASLFGAGVFSKEAVEAIEAFALDHRCIFSVEQDTPTFEKDDIF